MIRGTVRGLAAAAMTLAATAAAAAGDYADRALLGFSPDGATFAFEEYGVQDGSGFPYASIYVIDTDADAWVSGTPIRVRLESEAAPLAEARADALRRARPILDAHGIGAPGTLLVSNPVNERSADPLTVRFVTNPYLGSPDRVWTATLTAIPFETSQPCENLGPVQGFRLVLSRSAGPRRMLHDDAALPASRGCSQEYAISDVILFSPERAAPVLVVLVSVYSQGFEGPDRRFLAVAARFEDD